MANNDKSTEIVTLPLASKLNMNENKGTINTKFDMFNECNAPIYGGNLYPIHSKRINDQLGIYDKHGDLWSITGDGVKKNGNTVLPNTASIKKTFDVFEWEKCPYEFDQGILVRQSSMAVNSFYVSNSGAGTQSETRTYDIFGFVGGYLKNGQVSLHKFENFGRYDSSTKMQKPESRYVDGYDYQVSVPQFDLDKPTINFRLINIPTGFAMIEVKAGTDSMYLRITKYGYGQTFQQHKIIPFNFYRCDSNGVFTTEPVSSKFGATSGIADSPQIIVSAPFLIGGESYYGITVLNHRQIGKNGHKDCRFCNFVVKTDLEDFPIEGIHITCGITDWYTFVDDDTYVYPITTYHENYTAGISFSQLVTSGKFAIAGSLENASLSDKVLTATVTQEETLFAGSLYNFGVLSGLIIPSAVTNQRRHRFMVAGPTMYKTNDYGMGGSYAVDNMFPGKCIRDMGMQSTLTLPSDLDSWQSLDEDKKSIWNRRDEIDAGANNAQGAMANIRDTHFRVLFNYTQGYVSGISWANVYDDMGTLITQWDSVDDGFFINAYTNNNNDECVVWRDTRTGHIMFGFASDPSSSCNFHKYYTELQIVADRYIVANNNTYYNCIDLETGKKGHWASDWNNRILSGYTTSGVLDTDDLKVPSYFYKTGSTASGVDVAYLRQKTFAPSMFTPYNPYIAVVIGFEKVFGIGASGQDDVPIVDFFASSGTTAPIYKTSFIHSTQNASGEIVTILDGTLDGQVFPVVSAGSAFYNFPLPLTKFIKSFAGRFGVKINKTGYSLVYDGIRPVGLYNSTSMVDNIDEFFIVNSQYYAIVNDIICAISYNSNYILNGIESIIDVNGMQFIGAFPSCAYFYSGASHSIYAFTGDADLQMFVQTDRISTVYWYLYAPNNEWIYLNTNDGLYVMTQSNVFKLNGLLNHYGMATLGLESWNAFSTDKNYNIIQDWNGATYSVSLDFDPDDQKSFSNGVVIDTAYYGPGDMRQDTFDAWFVKIFVPSKFELNSRVRLQSSLMLDNKIVECEAEMYAIGKVNLDDNNCYIIRYQPSVQKPSLASKLRIESPYPINSISFSHKGISTFIYNNSTVNSFARGVNI